MSVRSIFLTSSLALGLVSLSAPAGGEPERALARWAGGELDRGRFRLLYDPDGRALAEGGESLRVALCKALYREIYEARALVQGLEKDPEIISELALWRRQRLAQLYEARHFNAEVFDEDVRALYERERSSTYLMPATASLDVLFVRCGTSPAERTACRARMAEHARRLAAGEDLAAVAASEATASGPANGSFEGLPLDRLDPALAAAVAALAPGEVSPPIETFQGWYRLRLTARTPSAPAPFDTMASAARQRAVEEKRARFRAGISGELDPEAALAAAAEAEGLAQSPEFLAEEARQRSWVLADAAFFRHAEVLPTDQVLTARLHAEEERFRHWQLVVATLPGDAPLPETLAAVERIKAALTGTRDPAARLGALGAEIPGLEVEALAPATTPELGARSPRLAALLAALSPGAWVGPEPVAWRRLPGAVRSAARSQERPSPGLLFVAVAATTLPPLAEVRAELLRADRAKLGDGVSSFLDILGPVWKIELLVP